MQCIRANQSTPGVEGHVAVAICSATPPSGVAIAPCFFQLQPQGDAAFAELQLTPAGHFKPRDGRAMPVDSWYIDAAIAAQVIARFRANRTPPVVDYEHQTLLAEQNGLPAPAAGFIKDLEWRDGSGLWAKVELTARARQYVADGEYRYVSPVFSFNEKTGAVVQLVMAAITNNPALDGLAQIEQRAAARYAFNEEPAMKNKLLLAICAALAINWEGREEAAVEADAIAALTALKDKPDPLAALRTQLKLGDTAGAEDITTAVAALKSKADNAGNPDPSKFVGVEVVEELRTQLATLTASHNERAIEELVKPALEDGRLLPAQEKWARDLGKKDLAMLTAYLKDAKPIAALRGTQTGGKDPNEEKDENGLTSDELAVCRVTGIDPKDYATSKKAISAA